MTSTPIGTFVYQGETYTLVDGVPFLDWRNKPVLTHWQGCILCCAVRVGEPPRHPRQCGNCGPAWERRRPDRCPFCQRTAHLNHHGQPVHKACLEAAITAAHHAQTDRHEPAPGRRAA